MRTWRASIAAGAVALAVWSSCALAAVDAAAELVDQSLRLVDVIRSEISGGSFGRMMLNRAQAIHGQSQRLQAVVDRRGVTGSQIQPAAANVQRAIDEFDQSARDGRLPRAARDAMDRIRSALAEVRLMSPPEWNRPGPRPSPPRPSPGVREMRDLQDEIRQMHDMLRRFGLNRFYESLRRDLDGFSSQVSRAEQLVRLDRTSRQIEEAFGGVERAAWSVDAVVRNAECDRSVRNAWEQVVRAMQRAADALGVMLSPDWDLPWQESPGRERPSRDLIRRTDNLLTQIDVYARSLSITAESTPQGLRLLSRVRELGDSAFEFRELLQDGARRDALVAAVEYIESRFGRAARAYDRLVEVDRRFGSPLFQQIGTSVAQLRAAVK